MRGKRRQLMALNEIQIVDQTADYPPLNPIPTHTFTINGEILPVFTMRPGGECVDNGCCGRCDRIVPPEQLSALFSSLRAETQFWQLANLGSGSYYTIAVDRHDFTVLEKDGAPAWKSDQTEALLFVQGGLDLEQYPPAGLVLGPLISHLCHIKRTGARYGVAITASMQPGDYAIRTLGFDGGMVR